MRKMKEEIKKLVIGSLILGSFCVQAGRSVRTIKRINVTEIRNFHDKFFELNKQINRDYNEAILDRAMHEVSRYLGLKSEDHIETPEVKIIYEMTRRQRSNILMSSRWSEGWSNESAENAIRFLDVFLAYSYQEFSVPVSFNSALKELGMAHSGNLEKIKLRMLERAEDATLSEFFKNKESSMPEEVEDRTHP